MKDNFVSLMVICMIYMYMATILIAVFVQGELIDGETVSQGVLNQHFINTFSPIKSIRKGLLSKPSVAIEVVYASTNNLPVKDLFKALRIRSAAISHGKLESLALSVWARIRDVGCALMKLMSRDQFEH